MSRHFALGFLACLLLSPPTSAAEDIPVGVVCNVKVLSDRVPDVSSMEAWQRSFIKPGMSDRDKALAAWRTTVMFQHQDAPPVEFLQNEAVVQDPIKMFNVYGYSFCSVACCDVAALARFAGIKARGWAINGHSVPEVSWGGGWHMLDASLINYFPRADGDVASVEEILAATKDWYARNPGYKGNDAKLRPSSRRAAGRAGGRGRTCSAAARSTMRAAGGRPRHTAGTPPCRSTTAPTARRANRSSTSTATRRAIASTFNFVRANG